MSWLLAGLACLAAHAEVAAADDRPNIVLAMTDDQGWGDVAYSGHPTLKTPVLDEMAASGLRFDRFYAAHPVCSPTRGSFLTGRHPNRFACFSWGHTLRPQEITVAEALRDAGYATGHFGKWHLGSCRAEDEVSPGNSGFDTWVSSPNYYENDPLMSANGKVVRLEGESSMVTARQALKFIREQHAAKRPFLAVVWFGNPHSPHQALPELQELYPDATKAERNYYGEITGVDRAMGVLREGLRETGAADNTLLWFTSDNGPQGRSPGLSGGLRGAKGSLWEGGVRVPGIIEWPARVKSPRTTHVSAVTSDIYPTVLAAAGVKLPQGQPPLDGMDLLPVIDGTEAERTQPIGFWVHPTGGIRTPSAELLAAQMAEQAGEQPAAAPPERTPASRMETKFPTDDFPGHSTWLNENWKLHRIPTRGRGIRYELYDLSRDQQESKDLAGSEEERVAAMSQQLEAWLGSVTRSLNGDDY